MGWFWSLLIVSILIAFNVFAADSMVRLRHDVRDIHKIVAALRPQPSIAAAASVQPRPIPPRT